MKDNKLKKVLVILGIVILIIVVLFITLGVLPDLLLHFRGMLKKFPFLQNLFVDEITDKDYINIMVGPLFSCAAIFVSILAFHTAKSTGKIQSIQRNALIIMATTNINKIIRKNMDVINSLNNNTGNITELLVDDDVVKDAAYLYGAKKISLDQFRLFKNFSKTVSKILELHNQGKDDEKKAVIKEFCKTYFKEDSIEYVTQLNELKQTLDSLENEVK